MASEGKGVVKISDLEEIFSLGSDPNETCSRILMLMHGPKPGKGPKPKPEVEEPMSTRRRLPRKKESDAGTDAAAA